MTTELNTFPVIPVVEIEDADKAVPLAEALLEGGIGIIEVTLRTDAAVEAIRRISAECPDMLTGAGTVLSTDDAQRVCEAGASFGVSPGTNPAIVEYFESARIPFIPGAITPSEVEHAFSLGCRYLKFFPAGVAGGPAFLRALSAPYRNLGICFCATGGVTLDNMNEYLSVPLVNAVGGSWLATPRLIEQGDWSTITANARQAMARIA